MGTKAWAAFVVHFWLVGLSACFTEQQNEIFEVVLV